ncbi:hypothetical protein DL98DRAFT_634151 [Cadophora sp. DSE1049]|nr:hypothetical protein DL98DRAFT_634151 [Cadophora sp. DSE1049]
MSRLIYFPSPTTSRPSNVAWTTSITAEPEDDLQQCQTCFIATFTPFPRLPPELRDQIWEKALPGRRVLRLGGLTDPFHRIKFEGTSMGSHDFWFETMTYRYSPDFTTRDKDIPMLRAWKHSRAVVLKAYPLSLPSIGGKNEIRFNKHDIIVFKDFYDLSQGLRNAILRKYPIPSAITQIQNLGFYASEPHLPDNDPDDNSNMFHKLATMDHGSLEVMLGIFTGTQNLVLISDALKKITRNGICEEFEMGKKACDRYDSIAQQILGSEARQAREMFLRAVRSIGPFSIHRTPKVLIMARRDKVHEEVEGLEGEKKKKKGNLLMRGGRRLTRMVKKLRKIGQ